MVYRSLSRQTYMQNLTKALVVIITPLLILLAGLNMAVLAGCAIASIGQNTKDNSIVMGLIHIPEPARATASAAFLVVNVFAVLIFLWKLRVPFYAARQNKMTLTQFALLPLHERTSLIDAVSVRAMP
jgi:hypothetical protein